MADISFPSLYTPAVQNLTVLKRAALAANGRNLIVNALMTSPPTIAVTTTSPALGQIFSAVTDASKYLAIGGVPFNNGGKIALKSATVTTGNVGGTSQQNQVAFEVMTDALSFCFVGYTQSETKCRVAIGTTPQDMQYLTSGVTTLTTGTFNFVTISGMAAGTKRIRLEVGTGGFLFDTFQAPATYGVWRPSEAAPVKALLQGDSFFVNGASDGFSHQNIASVASFMLGWQCTCIAVAGTGEVTTGANANYAARIADFSLISGANAVLIYGSINDASQNAATMQANALLTMQGARAAQPNALIIRTGTGSGATGPNAANLASEAAYLAAFNQFADPNSVFIPISNDSNGAWISGTGKVGSTTGTGNSDRYTASDGVHPTNTGTGSGMDYMGRRLATAIASVISVLAA